MAGVRKPSPLRSFIGDPANRRRSNSDIWYGRLMPGFGDEAATAFRSVGPAAYIGPHKIMWATDYPYQDGFFPGAPKMIHDRLGPLSAEAKRQVMAGGTLGFYGMK